MGTDVGFVMSYQQFVRNMGNSVIVNALTAMFTAPGEISSFSSAM